jgi:hypothetical protein
MLRSYLSGTLALLTLSSVLNPSLGAPAPIPQEQGGISGSPGEGDVSNNPDKPPQWLIDTANGNWPGIDWTYTANQGGCDHGQFAILLESTRMALEMMDFSGPHLEDAFETTGFNRYFMKDRKWKSNAEFWAIFSGNYS